MKKNKMLRLASALLILVMLTTSIVGSTFAKYTTTGSASDTARVAKWGVVINTSGTLYSDAYAAKNVTDSNLPATWTDASPSKDTITVASATQADNIVAPGTKSYDKGLSFAMSGTPEVAVSLTATIKAEDIFLKAGTYGVLVKASVSDTDSLKKVIGEYSEGVYSLKDNAYTKVTDTTTYDSNAEYYGLTNKVSFTADYYPVVYTLDGTTKYGSSDPHTATKAAELLATALNQGTAPTQTGDTVINYSISSKDLPANTDLGGNSGLKFADENLTWEWPFEAATTGAGSTPSTPSETDLKDTLLGDMIAARAAATTTHKFVSIDNTGTATGLTISNSDKDYTVKNESNTVVANLNTQFSIELTVTQID